MRSKGNINLSAYLCMGLETCRLHYQKEDSKMHGGSYFERSKANRNEKMAVQLLKAVYSAR
jgi:hypothetical protein